VDLTFRTIRLPGVGETMTGKSFSQGFGGKGANQAAMAARLGAAVTMIGCVGNDAFGRQALQNLQQHGVDSSHVITDANCPTGCAAILVDDRADNCIVVFPGANGALSTEAVRLAASLIQQAVIVIAQLETPVDATLEAFRLARAAGVRTLLNPAPAGAGLSELLPLTDLCVPNESEVQILTGMPANNIADAKSAARSLQATGPGAVIVTLGNRGAVLVEKGEPTKIPAFAVSAVDPTGAGDAFIGALAVYMAQGQPLAEAARGASAAAALSVTRPGAMASFPSKLEVEAFLTQVAT
jgi:ribokinase